MYCQENSGFRFIEIICTKAFLLTLVIFFNTTRTNLKNIYSRFHFVMIQLMHIQEANTKEVKRVSPPGYLSDTLAVDPPTIADH